MNLPRGPGRGSRWVVGGCAVFWLGLLGWGIGVPADRHGLAILGLVGGTIGWLLWTYADYCDQRE